jgi:hypothetical protein
MANDPRFPYGHADLQGGFAGASPQGGCNVIDYDPVAEEFFYRPARGGDDVVPVFLARDSAGRVAAAAGSASQVQDLVPPDLVSRAEAVQGSGSYTVSLAEATPFPTIAMDDQDPSLGGIAFRHAVVNDSVSSAQMTSLFADASYYAQAEVDATACLPYSNVDVRSAGTGPVGMGVDRYWTTTGVVDIDESVTELYSLLAVMDGTGNIRYPVLVGTDAAQWEGVSRISVADVTPPDLSHVSLAAVPGSAALTLAAKSTDRGDLARGSDTRLTVELFDLGNISLADAGLDLSAPDPLDGKANSLVGSRATQDVAPAGGTAEAAFEIQLEAPDHPIDDLHLYVAKAVAADSSGNLSGPVWVAARAPDLTPPEISGLAVNQAAGQAYEFSLAGSVAVSDLNVDSGSLVALRAFLTTDKAPATEAEVEAILAGAAVGSPGAVAAVLYADPDGTTDLTGRLAVSNSVGDPPGYPAVPVTFNTEKVWYTLAARDPDSNLSFATEEIAVAHPGLVWDLAAVPGTNPLAELDVAWQYVPGSFPSAQVVRVVGLVVEGAAAGAYGSADLVAISNMDANQLKAAGSNLFVEQVQAGSTPQDNAAAVVAGLSSGVAHTVFLTTDHVPPGGARYVLSIEATTNSVPAGVDLDQLELVSLAAPPLAATTGSLGLEFETADAYRVHTVAVALPGDARLLADPGEVRARSLAGGTTFAYQPPTDPNASDAQKAFEGAGAGSGNIGGLTAGTGYVVYAVAESLQADSHLGQAVTACNASTARFPSGSSPDDQTVPPDPLGFQGASPLETPFVETGTDPVFVDFQDGQGAGFVAESPPAPLAVVAVASVGLVPSGPAVDDELSGSGYAHRDPAAALDTALSHRTTGIALLDASQLTRVPLRAWRDCSWAVSAPVRFPADGLRAPVHLFDSGDGAMVTLSADLETLTYEEGSGAPAVDVSISGAIDTGTGVGAWRTVAVACAPSTSAVPAPADGAPRAGSVAVYVDGALKLTFESPPPGQPPAATDPAPALFADLPADADGSMLRFGDGVGLAASAPPAPPASGPFAPATSGGGASLLPSGGLRAPTPGAGQPGDAVDTTSGTAAAFYSVGVSGFNWSVRDWSVAFDLQTDGDGALPPAGGASPAPVALAAFLTGGTVSHTISLRHAPGDDSFYDVVVTGGASAPEVVASFTAASFHGSVWRSASLVKRGGLLSFSLGELVRGAAVRSVFASAGRDPACDRMRLFSEYEHPPADPGDGGYFRGLVRNTAVSVAPDPAPALSLAAGGATLLDPQTGDYGIEWTATARTHDVLLVQSTAPLADPASATPRVVTNPSQGTSVADHGEAANVAGRGSAEITGATAARSAAHYAYLAARTYGFTVSDPFEVQVVEPHALVPGAPAPPSLSSFAVEPEFFRARVSAAPSGGASVAWRVHPGVEAPPSASDVAGAPPPTIDAGFAKDLQPGTEYTVSAVAVDNGAYSGVRSAVVKTFESFLEAGSVSASSPSPGVVRSKFRLALPESGVHTVQVLALETGSDRLAAFRALSDPADKLAAFAAPENSGFASSVTFPASPAAPGASEEIYVAGLAAGKEYSVFVYASRAATAEIPVFEERRVWALRSDGTDPGDLDFAGSGESDAFAGAAAGGYYYSLDGTLEPTDVGEAVASAAPLEGLDGGVLYAPGVSRQGGASSSSLDTSLGQRVSTPASGPALSDDRSAVSTGGGFTASVSVRAGGAGYSPPQGAVFVMSLGADDGQSGSSAVSVVWDPFVGLNLVSQYSSGSHYGGGAPINDASRMPSSDSWREMTVTVEPGGKTVRLFLDGGLVSVLYMNSSDPPCLGAPVVLGGTLDSSLVNFTPEAGLLFGGLGIIRSEASAPEVLGIAARFQPESAGPLRRAPFDSPADPYSDPAFLAYGSVPDSLSERSADGVRSLDSRAAPADVAGQVRAGSAPAGYDPTADVAVVSVWVFCTEATGGTAEIFVNEPDSDIDPSGLALLSLSYEMTSSYTSVATLALAGTAWAIAADGPAPREWTLLVARLAPDPVTPGNVIASLGKYTRLTGYSETALGSVNAASVSLLAVRVPRVVTNSPGALLDDVCVYVFAGADAPPVPALALAAAKASPELAQGERGPDGASSVSKVPPIVPVTLLAAGASAGADTAVVELGANEAAGTETFVLASGRPSGTVSGESVCRLGVPFGGPVAGSEATVTGLAPDRPYWLYKASRKRTEGAFSDAVLHAEVRTLGGASRDATRADLATPAGSAYDKFLVLDPDLGARAYALGLAGDAQAQAHPFTVSGIDWRGDDWELTVRVRPDPGAPDATQRELVAFPYAGGGGAPPDPVRFDGEGFFLAGSDLSVQYVQFPLSLANPLSSRPADPGWRSVTVRSKFRDQFVVVLVDGAEVGKHFSSGFGPAAHDDPAAPAAADLLLLADGLRGRLAKGFDTTVSEPAPGAELLRSSYLTSSPDTLAVSDSFGIPLPVSVRDGAPAFALDTRPSDASGGRYSLGLAGFNWAGQDWTFFFETESVPAGGYDPDSTGAPGFEALLALTDSGGESVAELGMTTAGELALRHSLASHSTQAPNPPAQWEYEELYTGSGAAAAPVVTGATVTGVQTGSLSVSFNVTVPASSEVWGGLADPPPPDPAVAAAIDPAEIVFGPEHPAGGAWASFSNAHGPEGPVMADPALGAPWAPPSWGAYERDPDTGGLVLVQSRSEITARLARPYELTAVTVMGDGADPGSVPSSWKLEGSADAGDTWTTLHTQSTALGTANLAQSTVLLPGAAGAEYGLVRLSVEATVSGLSPPPKVLQFGLQGMTGHPLPVPNYVYVTKTASDLEVRLGSTASAPVLAATHAALTAPDPRSAGLRFLPGRVRGIVWGVGIDPVPQTPPTVSLEQTPAPMTATGITGYESTHRVPSFPSASARVVYYAWWPYEPSPAPAPSDLRSLALSGAENAGRVEPDSTRYDLPLPKALPGPNVYRVYACAEDSRGALQSSASAKTSISKSGFSTNITQIDSVSFDRTGFDRVDVSVTTSPSSSTRPDLRVVAAPESLFGSGLAPTALEAVGPALSGHPSVVAKVDLDGSSRTDDTSVAVAVGLAPGTRYGLAVGAFRSNPGGDTNAPVQPALYETPSGYLESSATNPTQASGTDPAASTSWSPLLISGSPLALAAVRVAHSIGDSLDPRIPRADRARLEAAPLGEFVTSVRIAPAPGDPAESFEGLGSADYDSVLEILVPGSSDGSVEFANAFHGKLLVSAAAGYAPNVSGGSTNLPATLSALGARYGGSFAPRAYDFLRRPGAFFWDFEQGDSPPSAVAGGAPDTDVTVSAEPAGTLAFSTSGAGPCGERHLEVGGAGEPGQPRVPRGLRATLGSPAPHSVVVAAWFRASRASAARQTLFGFHLADGSADPDEPAFSLYSDASGDLVFAGDDSLGIAPPGADKWTHFCVSISGGAARVFVDGEVQASVIDVPTLGHAIGSVTVGCSGSAPGSASAASWFRGYADGLLVVPGASLHGAPTAALAYGIGAPAVPAPSRALSFDRPCAPWFDDRSRAYGSASARADASRVSERVLLDYGSGRPMVPAAAWASFPSPAAGAPFAVSFQVSGGYQPGVYSQPAAILSLLSSDLSGPVGVLHIAPAEDGETASLVAGPDPSNPASSAPLSIIKSASPGAPLGTAAGGALPLHVTVSGVWGTSQYRVYSGGAAAFEVDSSLLASARLAVSSPAPNSVIESVEVRAEQVAGGAQASAVAKRAMCSVRPADSLSDTEDTGFAFESVSLEGPGPALVGYSYVFEEESGTPYTSADAPVVVHSYRPVEPEAGSVFARASPHAGPGAGARGLRGALPAQFPGAGGVSWVPGARVFLQGAVVRSSGQGTVCASAGFAPSVRVPDRAPGRALPQTAAKGSGIHSRTSADDAGDRSLSDSHYHHMDLVPFLGPVRLWSSAVTGGQFGVCAAPVELLHLNSGANDSPWSAELFVCLEVRAAAQGGKFPVLAEGDCKVELNIGGSWSDGTYLVWSGPSGVPGPSASPPVPACGAGSAPDLADGLFHLLEVGSRGGGAVHVYVDGLEVSPSGGYPWVYTSLSSQCLGDASSLGTGCVCFLGRVAHHHQSSSSGDYYTPPDPAALVLAGSAWDAASPGGVGYTIPLLAGWNLAKAYFLPSVYTVPESAVTSIRDALKAGNAVTAEATEIAREDLYDAGFVARFAATAEAGTAHRVYVFGVTGGASPAVVFHDASVGTVGVGVLDLPSGAGSVGISSATAQADQAEHEVGDPGDFVHDRPSPALKSSGAESDDTTLLVRTSHSPGGAALSEARVSSYAGGSDLGYVFDESEMLTALQSSTSGSDPASLVVSGLSPGAAAGSRVLRARVEVTGGDSAYAQAVTAPVPESAAFRIEATESADSSKGAPDWGTVVSVANIDSQSGSGTGAAGTAVLVLHARDPDTLEALGKLFDLGDGGAVAASADVIASDHSGGGSVLVPPRPIIGAGASVATVLSVTADPPAGSSFTPEKCFNDKFDYLQAGPGSPPFIVTLQLDKPYVVTRYKIWPRGSSAYPDAPTDYTLRGSSDGVAWDILDTQANNPPPFYDISNSVIVDDSYGHLDLPVASPGAYAYYQLHVTHTTGPNRNDQYLNIGELQLIGYDPFPLAAPLIGAGASLATALNFNGTDPDTSFGATVNIFTGDFSIYHSINKSPPYIVQFELDSVYVVTRYKIWPRGNPDYPDAPIDYILQGSSDGVNWTDLDNRVNSPPPYYYVGADTTLVTDAYGHADNVVASPGAYNHYRLLITKTGGPLRDNLINVIGEMQLIGFAA